MYLLIDFREKDFINKLSEFCMIENDLPISLTINNITLYIKITNLLIGDFIIQTESSNSETNEIKFIFERKCIKDLCSSITDGRFREQKSRLLESIGDPAKICYIIEGKDKLPAQTSLPKLIINGSLINLIFKHQYKVIHTENKQDTFDIMILLYKKLLNNEFKDVSVNTGGVKLLKKSEKILNNKFANQLSIIPGVSYTTATIINKEYKTLKDLIDLYNSKENIKDKESLLTNIQLNEKRKLGNALSKKIYEYLCT